MISFSDIELARKRIGDSVFLSPCAFSEALSQKTGTRCWLKLENLQMTGSFKERGAVNKLQSLSADERQRGVVCASAGNHAQGVAYHATRLGLEATIVMPEVTPLTKVQRSREYLAGRGAIVLEGASYDEALAGAIRIADEANRVLIPGFDDDLILAGQGTIGLELIEQNPYLEAVVIPVGGGGLIGGIALAIKETNPKIKVYGVECAQMPSMTRALQAGHPVSLPGARTIAEGIAVGKVGERPLELVKRYVDDLVLVEEGEIAESILMFLEREKTVAEGAGATPLAAVLHQKLPVSGKKVALVVSGGNIDVNVVSRIIERGLVQSGRMVRMQVTIGDAAGSLAQFAGVIGKTRASIVQIHHDRTFGKTELNEAVAEVVLETKGFEHVEEVQRALSAAGYRFA